MHVSIKKEMRTSKIEFDPSIFKECTSKEFRIWRWLPPRNEKYVVHFTKGKFVIAKIG